MKLIAFLTLTILEAKNVVVFEDLILGSECVPLVDLCPEENHIFCDETISEVSFFFKLFLTFF